MTTKLTLPMLLGLAISTTKCRVIERLQSNGVQESIFLLRC